MMVRLNMECVDFGPFKAAFPLLFGGHTISLGVGTGWFLIVWGLCERLETLARRQVAEGKDLFRVVQIKEKFGGLRFYVTYKTPEILALIREAEDLSLKTCEVCGQPGGLKEVARWFHCVCPAHEAVWRADNGEFPFFRDHD